MALCNKHYITLHSCIIEQVLPRVRKKKPKH